MESLDVDRSRAQWIWPSICNLLALRFVFMNWLGTVKDQFVLIVANGGFRIR